MMRGSKAGRTDSLNSQPKPEETIYHNFEIEYGMQKYNVKKPTAQKSSLIR